MPELKLLGQVYDTIPEKHYNMKTGVVCTIVKECMWIF